MRDGGWWFLGSSIANSMMSRSTGKSNSGNENLRNLGCARSRISTMCLSSKARNRNTTPKNEEYKIQTLLRQWLKENAADDVQQKMRSATISTLTGRQLTTFLTSREDGIR